MDVVDDIGKAWKGFCGLFRDKKPGLCLSCQIVVNDSDELFCSQSCGFRYWAWYRKGKGNGVAHFVSIMLC